MAGETNLAEQLTSAFKGMSATQRVMVAAISVTVLLALTGLGIWAGQESKSVLAANISPQEASSIVAQLDKMQVPYELSSDQRTILVPESKVGQLRLKFAGDGLLSGDKLGFEKLENAGLGTTDFSQKVIHRRAMEATLAKTIMSLQQVAEATVHITPANDSPFLSDKEDAKASVLLKLRGSRMLPDENTQAIVNLVAASVEGLKPEQVVIIDQYSRILSRTGRDPMVGASDAQKKVAREEEDHLVRRVTELLEPVVGIGKVRATAHVDLDFDKVKINEEKFDPQGQVERSIGQKEEKVQKRDSGAGLPGTASNVAPANGGATANITENSEKKETTTNFEISKTVRAIDQATGSIKRVTLAVIVDHIGTWDKDAKGEPVLKQTPRSADELKKIRDQVSAAVGIQPKRGDELTVENMAFATLQVNPKEAAEARTQFWLDLARQYAPGAIWGIVGLAVFFMLILPMLRRMSQAINRPAPMRVASADGAELGVAGASGGSTRKPVQVKSMTEIEAEIEAELNADAAFSAPEARRRELIKKRLQDGSNDDPETMASLVRSWLLEEGR
ncbi:flagellar basal-body MS-ring/collar protein FliF [Geothrix sp. PMB-07]|uniref:flagellar basal-body MS-ring/collar protein FliF n=1 Tax=Geothrix sp. PMB-07 TaxID=3068640 RepID=UPI0027404A8C|nr:flagellar basal-body MS-ring/collar protein FliF [Geothrix sp. PMB-07]WLT32465.1 flagellar basal-body MS-ring/collar protein FliF [Geothrix sp. PMB-07]